MFQIRWMVRQSAVWWLSITCMGLGLVLIGYGLRLQWRAWSATPTATTLTPEAMPVADRCIESVHQQVTLGSAGHREYACLPGTEVEVTVTPIRNGCRESTLIVTSCTCPKEK